MKIALIDDQRVQLQETKQLLQDFLLQKKLDFEVNTFLSGEDFLETYCPFSYTIIFLDNYMEGMSGVEVAQQIRRQDSNCCLIFLTSSSEYMPEAFSCHAFDYLQKPVNAENLSKVMTDLLRTLPQSTPTLEFSCNGVHICLPYSEVVGFFAEGHTTRVTDSKTRQYEQIWRNYTFTKLHEEINQRSLYE